MKNKGFTLVEMLGVMTLLAIIFALVYPNVIKMLEKGKTEDYSVFENNVYLAAETYVNSSNDISKQLVNTNDQVTITFGQLMEKGYLSSEIVDPRTGNSIKEEPGYLVIVTLNANKTYRYKIES